MYYFYTILYQQTNVRENKTIRIKCLKVMNTRATLLLLIPPSLFIQVAPKFISVYYVLFVCCMLRSLAQDLNTWVTLSQPLHEICFFPYTKLPMNTNISVDFLAAQANNLSLHVLKSNKAPPTYSLLQALSVWMQHRRCLLCC